MAVEAISPVYETAPWGMTDQPDFLNICLLGRTRMTPHKLLKEFKSIEGALGRQPGERWGPRVIDIDLIFYDDVIIDDDQLSVPHPQLSQRLFVLAPLADIAPSLVDVRSGHSVIELLAEHDMRSARKLSGPGSMLRRPTIFAWGVKTYVMGILNVTPDSFSGDGLMEKRDWAEAAAEAAVAQAIDFVAAGTDILDVGGESTRPGSTLVLVEEERDRVLPVIEAVRRAVDVPISVDTYRAPVAEAALQKGADWINDVWGLRMDPDMAGLAATSGCPIIVMHNRSKPRNVEQKERLGGRYVGIEYQDLLLDIKNELLESVDLALNHGVSAEQIIIDPGIGFGKTVSQNTRLLNELSQFRELGYPILVGPSRKSFIGYTLGLPPDQRKEGTAAAVAIAIDRGADIVRVHDVEEMTRVSRMTDRIVRQ
jgi:dihydropteroate synthase/2-amino-4-hydroxy-6-hydroxymethyldihydropteridine diphosphokinase